MTSKKVFGLLMLAVRFLVGLMDNRSTSQPPNILVADADLNLIPVVSSPCAPTAEEIEAERKAGIARRLAARRERTRAKRASRLVEATVVDEPAASMITTSPSAEEVVAALRQTIVASVDEGSKALAGNGADAMKSVDAALDKAKAAYRALTEHESKPNLSGVYSPIKELERAKGKALQSLHEREAMTQRLAAEEAKRAAAKAEESLKVEQAKQSALVAHKQATTDYIGRLTKMEMFIEDGRADLARAELETLRPARLATNEARSRYNELWSRRKPLFGYKAIRRLETQLKDLELKREQEEKAFAEREAELSDARLKLGTFFGITIDSTFTLPTAYSPHRTSSKRCAVCLEQAKSLIEKIGKHDVFAPLVESMQAYLLRGLKDWGVQLCDEKANMAFDEPSRPFGHRVFQRRFGLIDKNVDKETGAIRDLDELESSIAATVAKPDFKRIFATYQSDVGKLRARKPRKPNVAA